MAQWDHEHLTNIFIYTDKSSKRFDRVKAVGASESQELRGLGEDWLKTHVFAVKLEDLEVFKFQVEPPGGWTGKAIAVRTTASIPDLGGWLVEAEKSVNVDKALKEEIEIRQIWVRNNNLDAERFKAWSNAEKICRKK